MFLSTSQASHTQWVQCSSADPTERRLPAATLRTKHGCQAVHQGCQGCQAVAGTAQAVLTDIPSPGGHFSNTVPPPTKLLHVVIRIIMDYDNVIFENITILPKASKDQLMCTFINFQISSTLHISKVACCVNTNILVGNKKTILARLDNHFMILGVYSITQDIRVQGSSGLETSFTFIKL